MSKSQKNGDNSNNGDMSKNAENRVYVLPVLNKRNKRKTRGTGGVELSDSQRRWLSRGVDQAGGKLPLFDEEGQRYSEKTIRSCLTKGLAEPWFENPIKPDWLICRLTDTGRQAVSAE